jgi:hypothetical protein
MNDDDFLSDDELFNMYLQALQSQLLDIDTAIKHKNKIIPLLRIIEASSEDSFQYKIANKKIAILTLEKPSFWKQVFNLN